LFHSQDGGIDGYAGPIHGGIATPNSDLLPSPLFKVNENQLALEAAIMELTLWAENRGADDVGDNARTTLQTIDKNEEFIRITLAVNRPRHLEF